jgi:hypothetical protein
MENLFSTAEKLMHKLNTNKINIYTTSIDIEKNEITLYGYFSFDLSCQLFQEKFELLEIGYYGCNVNLAKYRKGNIKIQAKH